MALMSKRGYAKKKSLENLRRGAKSGGKRAWNACCPTWHQVLESGSFLVYLTLAVACVVIAIANREDVPPPFGPSSKFFHRILVTDFEQQKVDELSPRARCPALYGELNNEEWGVDGVCTCLEQHIRSEMSLNKNMTIANFLDANAKVIIRECIELKGAMPIYVLTYAGTIASVDYIFWAFLCITASCVTSFTRMEAYPNHHTWLRRFLLVLCVGINCWVFVQSCVMWSRNFDSFETEKNNEMRMQDPNSCATIRFIFAFSVISFFLHIPHYLSHWGILTWEYPELFIHPKDKTLVRKDATDHIAFLDFFNGNHEINENEPEDQVTYFDNEKDFTNQINYDSEWDDRESKTQRLKSKEIRASIYAYALNERDEQFRISYWQAVSEDINFTMGCVLLAVTFSAHGGVHDDSTLLMDLCCVFMIGILQHFSHVLMLVKEYLFEDQTNTLEGEIEMNGERETVICKNIGNTRLMIHFFVVSLIVFYCNRTAPSTFANDEVSSYFQVARFSVILGLCVCNTLYDIFFETVHIIKHMTEVGVYEVASTDDQDVYMYQVDAAPKDQESATKVFLDYHSQYQGPYLWRVHLVLPLLFIFGLITAALQRARPILKTDADVLLF